MMQLLFGNWIRIYSKHFYYSPPAAQASRQRRRRQSQAPAPRDSTAHPRKCGQSRGATAAPVAACQIHRP